MSRGLKTEHSGAKDGGGHYGTRKEAKKLSNHARRVEDKAFAERDRFSASPEDHAGQPASV